MTITHLTKSGLFSMICSFKMYHPGSGCRKLKDIVAPTTISKINWIGYKIIVYFKNIRGTRTQRKLN